MRLIRYAFLAGLAIILIAVALANRGFVTLRVLPDDMAGVLGYQWSISLPLFLVIFASIVAGVAIGFVWEWLREHKHRAEARHERIERQRLEREVDRLSDASSESGDDVLAMLEGPATAR